LSKTKSVASKKTESKRRVKKKMTKPKRR
jgi:hypothetical protein